MAHCIGGGALPAFLLLVSRLNLPETPLSLLHRGKFKEAKRVSKLLFDDDLAMLPDENVAIQRPRVSDFLKVILRDPIKKRATIFGWLSNACQGAEFAAWGFYMPTILLVAGVTATVDANGKQVENIVGNNLVTAGVFSLATVAGWLAPLMLKRIGHRGVAMWGYGLAFTGLMLGALSLWRIDVAEAAKMSAAPLESAAGGGSLPFDVGPLLGCVQLHDHYIDGGAGAIQGDRIRIWLYVREGGVFLCSVCVSAAGCRMGTGRRNSGRGCTVHDRIPGGQVHPARGVQLCRDGGRERGGGKNGV